MMKKLFLVLLLAAVALAATSTVIKYPAQQVSGTGPLPYNYRLIDGHLHAGGHPLDPADSFKNTDSRVRSILNYLKSKGVRTVIDLENTQKIQSRYQRLLDQAKIKRIHIPLNSVSVPDKKEWARIKEALKQPVYVHCKWGADRTGMVIARYLVEEHGYTPDQAYRAVLTGGSHAGAKGGFKTYLLNLKLKNFIFDGPK